ncbi:MAG TPA: Ig-like domain-containing protein [Terrimesophilobacter sp.]|nr:Ig-like domain-containing protein [Terrimesophilobacter sp.]
MTVRALDENSPPHQVWSSSTLVAQGGRVSASVLGDWVDPDGDAIYLASATTPQPDSVTFTAAGMVVFTEGGAASRSRTVALVVTDGQAEGVGSLSIEVGPVGEVPILAENFVVLAYAGQELRVEPLGHVRGGSGEIRLSSVSPVTGATVTPNLDDGTFRFISDSPRTYLLQYVVNDGSQTATGVARIDVAAPPDANSKPVTVPKTVFVQTLGTNTVDIATTDIDPSGGVLLVTGVYNVPLRTGVQVELIEHRAARVSLTAPLDDGPVTFNYRVSNGLAESEGEVTVIEIPRPSRLQPPVAETDSVSVRVGAVIDIPVLANDVHPDGEELSLARELAVPVAEGGGLLFASGNVLRYLAPDVPGDFSATYTVTGPDGQAANARVNITVRERVELTNRAPAPRIVTARVLAGETVVIPIPLTGIDPDGDTVQLLGQESNPEKGSVTAAGPDSLQYEAGSYSAGSDSFSYSVMDALGARATGTVRIGISPRLEGPRNPVATPDSVSMRPGGTVTVQVLTNDSDPDGSPLTVITVDPSDEEVLATTDGEVVSVTPPPVPGDYGIVYTIQNEFGGTSSAFLTVTVDPNAPRAFPVVRDAVLNLTDILDLDEIDVNVLAGAFWADGSVSELGVSLVPGYGQGAVVTDTKRIRVTIGDRSQIIPFAVSHPDDASLRALAFVWVPGYDDALPQVNRRAPMLTVASESTLTIDLTEYVVAIGGGPVWLTDTSTVHATHANGDGVVVDRQTLQFTSADKYFGPASISFEVTDGTTWDDPEGRRATLVLPIAVTPRENQPPVFNGAVLSFEPAQELVIDLLRLTTYPYPDDVDELAYTALAPLPTGFSYSLTGQQLTIRANENALKGSTTALVLAVRDDLEEGKSGRIELTVVASSRPLASPAADSFVAPRGETTVFDVLANDQATNPFPGAPMTVVDVRGAGGAELPAGVSVVPSADNRLLSVTVSADAVPGDINLQYQVLDATLDADRAVWGNVRVQIQDVPDAVTGARVTSFGDSRLTVAWSPGAANNSPITGYEVTATRADGSVVGVTPCSVTSGCDVVTPGNGPGHGVRVSVVAINSIGKSAPASVPGTVWSDVLPAAVGGVAAVPTSLAPAGGSIGVSWTLVPDPANGSPVVEYIVRITGPGADLTFSRPPSATGFTYDNAAAVLAPNTAYSVNVHAKNSAQVLSSSAWLRNAPVSVTTVGPPGPAAGGVSGVVINPQGHVQVSWGASNPNGSPSPVTYSVGRFVEGEVLPTSCQPPSPGSGGEVASPWVDATVGDQVTYRYAVYSDNDFYCTVTVSGPVLTMQPPGQASGSTTIEFRDGQFDVRAGSDLAVASLTAEKFQVSINGGAFSDVVPGQWLTSSANLAVYGSDLTVQYRGCRDSSELFCGPASDPTTVKPVNTRVPDMLSCVVGAQAMPSPPANPGGTPTVSYLFSFHDGGAASEWSAFSPDGTVPPPAPPLDPDDPDEPPAVVQVRVKATVDFGDGTPRTNEGFEQFMCSTS